MRAVVPVLVLSTMVVATLAGCRDLDPRLSATGNMLSGRTLAGAPSTVVSPADVSAGRLVARSEFLRPMEDRLGILSIDFNLFSNVTLRANASRFFGFDRTAGLATWTSLTTNPLIASISVPIFRRDYASLCVLPGGVARSPFDSSFPPIAGECDPIEIENEDILRVFLDDFALRTRMENATVSWSAPVGIYPESCTYPVTSMACPRVCTRTSELCTSDADCGTRGGLCAGSGCDSIGRFVSCREVFQDVDRDRVDDFDDCPT